MTAKQISNSTCKNPLLSKVLYHVKMGWPDEVPTTMQPYVNRKEELTVLNVGIMGNYTTRITTQDD